MAEFSIYFPTVCQLEGTVYENPANDQCNKFGIEVEDLQEYAAHTNSGANPTCADVAALTSDTAYPVIKTLYWDFFKADLINNQSLAMYIVDSGYNQGRQLIAKYVQNILGITVDGIIGPGSINAINSFDAGSLFSKLYNMRKARYDAIVAANPSKQEFQKGWYNRMNAIPFSNNSTTA